MKAANLRVEYLSDPIGIDIAAPRIFWKLDSGAACAERAGGEKVAGAACADETGKNTVGGAPCGGETAEGTAPAASGRKQTAYQIIARRDGKEIWNTGKIISSEMTHIPYAGEALHSRDRAEFSVTLWDEHDTVGEAVSGFFELGLLEPADWSAKWISGDYKPKKNTRYPADCFKKTFPVKAGLKRARLYITACGLYEAQINGTRVGDFVLAPGSTDYRKRIQYQTYDVTELVRSAGQVGAVKTAGIQTESAWEDGVGSAGQVGAAQAESVQTESAREDGVSSAGQVGAAQTEGARTESPAGADLENVLEITLADGWYRGSVGCFAPTNVFGRQTKLLCQLELTYEDGQREVIGSDESFAWSNDGEVRFADLEDGEIIEAGRTPSYGGHAKAIKETLVPSASNNVPVTRHERLRGNPLQTPSGKTVIDFGQNIAGFAAFTLDGVKGKKIKLTFGEILDENGEFTQKNMQEETTANEMSQMQQIMLITGNKQRLKCEMKFSPKQEVVYTCKGGRESYETRFAIFGFRYALLESEFPIRFADMDAAFVDKTGRTNEGCSAAQETQNETAESLADANAAGARNAAAVSAAGTGNEGAKGEEGAVFEAVAVYSDMAVTGSFSCSDERVNKLWQNTLWSMKSNYADVPTDCPTRERLGWTGDAQIFFRTGAYMMDTSAFFRKWMCDLRDNQTKKGKISAVVPYNGCSMVYDNTGASVGWADAAVLIPYRYYEAFADKNILKENYGMMKAYAEFMIANTGHKDKKKAKANPFNKYVYEKGMHLGEWLEPEEFNEAVTAGKSALRTEEATAYLHYTMTYMEKTAKVLGFASDAARYREYAEGAAKAYSYLFLRGSSPDTDRQAKLVRPLAMGIGTDEERSAMEERLIQAVKNRNNCVMTGFLSTPFVLPVLTAAGRSDLAYDMLLNEERPGWLYEVLQGATTIWENWEGNLSQNHYSPGAVCQWLMETMAGIRQAGKAKFILEPVPDLPVGAGEVDKAEADGQDSAAGTAKTEMSKQDGAAGTFEKEVPGQDGAGRERITYAQGSFDSLYGKVESGWRISGGEVICTFTVPAGCTAEICLPNCAPETVEAGTYERRMPVQ